MDEDAERTLIFVDMLGFANLTKQLRYRVLHYPPDEMGFQVSSVSEIQSRLMRFRRVLDMCTFETSLTGSLHAMLFSDCAFLDVGTSLNAALTATDLIRNFIKEKVPVRIGMGKGTFYPLMFSTETSGKTIVARSLFVGTAIINSHAAEQCGGKGIRIFVHSSLKDELSTIGRRVKILDLTKPYKDVLWELDYLAERKPSSQASLEEENDRKLFDAIVEMNDLTAPLKVKRQYSETLKALNRMRLANSKSIFNIRRSKGRTM
jgi:hypothetical protein